MRHSGFVRWLRSIAETQNDEISCSECLDGVSAYVDREVQGLPGSAQDAQLEVHLRHCRVCHEEYEILRELAG